MVTRELIKNEIDQLHEHYLDIVYRFVRALIPRSTTKSAHNQGESWEEFLQNNYGIFSDDPLVREPQGTLEIREELE